MVLTNLSVLNNNYLLNYINQFPFLFHFYITHNFYTKNEYNPKKLILFLFLFNLKMNVLSVKKKKKLSVDKKTNF